jgi:hypothetical protein
MLERVRDQVVQRLRDPNRLAPDDRWPGGPEEVHLRPAGPVAPALDGSLRELAARHGLRLRTGRASVHDSVQISERCSGESDLLHQGGHPRTGDRAPIRRGERQCQRLQGATQLVQAAIQGSALTKMTPETAGHRDCQHGCEHPVHGSMSR